MFRTRLWTWYDENEQTAAEWWAFSRPRLAVGGASERRVAAKWANGCRVVLIFGIVQNPWFYQGFRARRDIDFKKTSKRLQSGAHFEYCAAFTSRSRRVRSRWREDVPKCLKINLAKTKRFWYFSERLATWASKTLIWPESGALFIKIVFSYDGLKIVILSAVHSENEHMAAEWCLFSIFESKSRDDSR